MNFPAGISVSPRPAKDPLSPAGRGSFLEIWPLAGSWQEGFVIAAGLPKVCNGSPQKSRSNRFCNEQLFHNSGQAFPNVCIAFVVTMGRLHPNLEKLQEVRQSLSYRGWEVDFQDAEDAHKEREHSTDFPKALRKLKVKQKIHEGDRSHPRLVALDAIIKKGLTFPGWEADVRQIEKMHADVPYFSRNDIGFNSKLRALEFSQRMHEQPGVPEQNIAKDQVQARRNTASDASNPLGSCIICGDEARSHAFVPCGHLCACEGCASKVMRRDARCPVCRASSLETVHIFL